MKAEEIINLAIKETGTKEDPPGSNKVKYNKWFYGKDVSGDSYPWCAAFISWLFKGSGLCPKTASCTSMLEWFEKNSQTVKTPRPGDIVFFKFKSNARRTNHVGIVTGVSGKTITTIEGNTSVTSNDNGGSVMQRKRSANIVAYARPAYESVGHPTLKMGDRGEEVKDLQARLNAKGYDCGKCDGIFGTSTKNAVLALQLDHKLKNDGIVGPKTWQVLE